MRKITFCFLFFWVSSFSFSQSSLPKNVSDSLWKVWSDTSNSNLTRLDAIQKYTWEGYVRANPDSALYFAQIQYNFAEQCNMRSHMANALNTQGAAYDNKGDYFVAIDHHNRCMTIRIDLGDEKGIAKSLNNLGLIYYHLNSYDEAINYHTQSLQISQKLEDKKGIALSYNNIGSIYQDKDDYQIALEYFTLCLNIRLELEDKKGLAATYNNIALIHFYQGAFVIALEFHLLSLKLKEEINDTRGIAISYSNIAIIYSKQGDYKTSLAYHSQSLILKEKINDKKGVSISLSNIGANYYAQNDNEQAMQYYFKSLALKEELGDKAGIALTLQNIGLVYIDQDSSLLALQCYYRCLIISEEIGDKRGISSALNGIGNIYNNHFNNYNEAISYSQRSIQIALEINSEFDIREGFRSLYRAHLRLGNWTKAYSMLSLLIQRRNKSLETNFFGMSEHEKQYFFGTMQDDYGLYYDFALHNKNDFVFASDTAFNMALQTKGLTLKSSTAMRYIIQSSGDSLLVNRYEYWISIKNKINRAGLKEDELSKLEEEATSLERELVKRSNAFSDFDKLKNLDWKQVRAGLNDGEAAIEFVHFNSEIDTACPIVYAAFVVRPDSEHPDVVKLCTEEDLKNILGAFQGNNLSFIEKVYGKKTEAKKELYEKIWQPLEPFLKDIKTVYYSPSGLLHKVSFTTICKEQDVYLSDVYNFRQMGSTGNLAFENKTEFGDLENFLLMGGVQYNSDSTEKKIWDYLPGSLSETNTINNYLQKKKFGVNYFKEGNASEEIFKEKITSSSIVHIATHGFFFPDPEQVREEMNANSESNQDLKFRGNTNYANWSFVNNKNPLMRSGIVLAGANDVWQRGALAEGEDGILTAQEVSNLDLRNTKLVVLSACETGLGDIKGSEGVFGLQRAFKMAGVKYLIMSLWQVPDKETSEFMILFYKNLIKEKDIPIAFQKTQKVMRAKYDPYYWGAFVLIE